MVSRHARILCISLAAALQACSSTGPGSQGQSSGRSNTVVEGTVLGGLVGAVVGNLAGKDTKSTAIGAAVGAGVGAGAGVLVDREQRRYASREDQLNQMLADSRKQNDELTGILSVAQRSLAADRTAITDLRRRLANAQQASAARADMNRQAARMREDLALYDKAIEVSDKSLNESRLVLADYRKQNPNANTRDLTMALSTQEQSQGKLKTVRAQHSQLLASVEGSNVVR
ncbi:YMGG-like glycine zipper-containing protein [Variovorax sp. KK3]